MSNYAYDDGGGFSNNPNSSQTSPSKPRRNYDEQTLIPVTIKMLHSSLSSPASTSSSTAEFHLQDQRPLHMVKFVGAVRSSDVRSTNLFLDVEDGTGLMNVKVWVNDGDDCSAIVDLRRKATEKDGKYVRIIGQLKEFDGVRTVVANDVREVEGGGNEITYHFLEVAHSHERHLKAVSGGPAMGMGYGIGNVASASHVPPMQQQHGVGVGQGLGGGSPLNDSVLQYIMSAGEGSDSGVNINDIIGNVSNKGFSANDIRNAINHLSNEGHIYSTIDENHYQYAC